MDTVATVFNKPIPPAQRRDEFGCAHIDFRVIMSLAAPFAAASVIQILLGLTDVWFVGRISVSALAAMAAVFWPILIVVTVFGGLGFASQTIISQAFGGQRRKRAAQATWMALWGALLCAPALALIALHGRDLFQLFGLSPEVEALALEFWQPRMMGAPLGVALGGVLGFFNGIGQPRITLAIGALAAISNAVLAPLLMFGLGWGIAGAAWATNCAQVLGLSAGLYAFLCRKMNRTFCSRLMWRPRAQRLWLQWKLGLPIGLQATADTFGFALFQLMQVQLGAVDGAAIQVVTMLASFAFLPAMAISIVGSMLVGQSIGMNDRRWARKIGNAIILMCMTCTACTGLIMGVCAPWLIPIFVPATDPQAADVVQVGASTMWIAGVYLLFDGLNLGCVCCLRGVGDVFVPAGLVIVLSWFLFVPLAHILSFERGGGWVEFLPQYGLGAVGGWTAAVVYIAASSLALAWRWRSATWESIRVR